MSSETEQRFQRRGQHVQTKLAGIATSIHIPTEERQGWVMKMLVVLQKVVERLNESVKGGNTMEELSVGLENTETRRYFDECTKKFGINYDTVLDTTEEKDNFEEITKVVDEVFEEVKGMVQDTWIIQREEESRRLNRSRMVFEPTSSGVDPGGQMGPGTMMYDNLGFGGRNQRGIVERVRQQRERDIQTLIARISRSKMISPKQRGRWIKTMIHRVQDVIGTLVETTNLSNSIEEVHTALNSRETREFFEVKMNRLKMSGTVWQGPGQVKQDVDIDKQEDRESVGEASLMVDKLFECVKSTAQDKWSISREWGYGEDDRAKKVGLWLDRPTEGRKQIGLNRPTSMQGKQQLEVGLDGSIQQIRFELAPDGSINQVQHELGIDGSTVQTSGRKLKQCKLRRDDQIYFFLCEIGNTVRTQDLRWTWNIWVSKLFDIEHETGVNLENECRESKDKIENIIKELLKDKAMKGQLTNTARQTAYINSLEDATRFQQRMMMTVNRQISGLRTEEEVIKSLREQKTIHFINVNTAKMIKDNSNEQDTNRLYQARQARLYREVCKLAMGQWKLQMKVFREMNEEQSEVVMVNSMVNSMVVNSIDSPKQDQVGDPSCDMVPGTCMKCKSDIMGPPNDRGGDNMKTWHKYCKGCFTLVRRMKYHTKDRHSEGTSNGDQVEHPINDSNPLTTHEVVDDLQEREVTLNVLRSLNEEQVATSNAIKLTSDKMKALMEQLVKTSSMINTVLVKLVKTDAHGDKTNDHPKLAVKPHDTSKEKDDGLDSMPDLWGDYDPDCDLLDCKVW